ncbi:hypothetical protein [Bradyrhizobium sp.]|jgi:hypothetical protein|uniref:hypothetical protein n=1 Tax=Bradyrhizobium sp. TaxID=376 RepID=UPI003C6EF50A
MTRKPLNLPPAVARAFVKDMLAFFARDRGAVKLASQRLFDRNADDEDRIIPSARAALTDTSITRPLTNGRRSLTRH